jgi:hypothetical protein
LSDETPSIHVALNRVKSAVGAVKKGDRNTAQNFNFRGIDAVVNACAGALNDHGVIVCPEVIEHEYDTVEVGRNNTKMGHVTLAVKYTFWGPAGDSISSTVLAESMDSGDKACAKAMSVAYRIALLQTLNLPTDEPDPDSQSYDRSVGELGVKVNVNRGVKLDWVAEITNAASSKELNEIWKNAGKTGDLQGEVMLPTGEKTTVQQLLYKKGEELGFPRSAKGTQSVSG